MVQTRKGRGDVGGTMANGVMGQAHTSIIDSTAAYMLRLACGSLMIDSFQVGYGPRVRQTAEVRTMRHSPIWPIQSQGAGEPTEHHLKAWETSKSFRSFSSVQYEIGRIELYQTCDSFPLYLTI